MTRKRRALALARVALPTSAALALVGVVVGVSGYAAQAVAALSASFLAGLVWLAVYLWTVRTGVALTLAATQRTPSATVELGRTYDRLAPDGATLPELGGWAVNPWAMIVMLDLVRSGQVSTILECGSGSSTVWFATALADRGGEGRVIALESSPEFAAATREELRRRGLDGRAEVVDAPLVPTRGETRRSQPWFDLAALPDVAEVDLLFVDGPPGNTSADARYPAFPALADRLRDGAVVVLDDTDRVDEAYVVERWSRETHHGRGLRVSRRLYDATVFEARSLEEGAGS
ncbi:O-methyltransferase [Mumia sp. DW29H23]|uniref:O-methyltransferase n=1 Tax=Mumia sp. DW29H23 TaxID=3421241 RepID=UPI003D685EAD